MKLLAIVLVIGFCLFAGVPLTVAVKCPGERRGACCTAEDTSGSGRMSCSIPGGMQTCTCKSQQSSSAPPHTCPATCSLLGVIPAQQTGIFLRIKNYIINGYRRITGKNVLDLDIRQKIYQEIISHPGVDIRTLAHLSDVNENTLRYHLEKMESVSKIKVIVIGGVRHFFENHGRYSDEQQVLLSRMFTSGSSRILHLVHNYPGLTRNELANHLGVAGPTVTRSISHLITDRLILSVRDGRNIRYYPEWNYRDT